MYKARCLLVEIEDKGWEGKSFKMNVIRCDLLLMKSSKSQESLTVIQTNTPQFPTNPRRTKQVFCLSNALVSDDEMRFYESLFSTSASCGAVFCLPEIGGNHEKSPLRGWGRLHGIPKTNTWKVNSCNYHPPIFVRDLPLSGRVPFPLAGYRPVPKLSVGCHGAAIECRWP